MGLLGFAARQAFHEVRRSGGRSQQRPAPQRDVYVPRRPGVKPGARGWAGALVLVLVALLPFALVFGVCVHVYHDRQAGDRAYEVQLEQSPAPLPSFGSAP